MRLRKGDNNMDAYREFAQIYDKLMDDIDYASWMNFINSTLETYKKRPHDILEMGCGTGSLTELLCREGYDVTAFDLSEDMLSLAYDKLGSYNNIQLLKQDMTEFSINKDFEMIISVCDSINYILDYSDLIKTFDNVYSHLKPGGIFVFDVNSYYKLKEIIGNNIFVEDREDVFYVWENDYDEENNTCEFFITFFIKEQGLYKRFDEIHIERAYTFYEIENALKKSGFSILNVFNGYSNEPLTSETERLVFLATK